LDQEYWLPVQWRSDTFLTPCESCRLSPTSISCRILKTPTLDWTGVVMQSMRMSSLNNPDRPSYITVECRLPAILHSSSALSVHRLTVSRLMHSLQRSTWPNCTLGWRHEEGLTVRPCLTRNQAYSLQEVHPSATTRHL
jgi:hypothetical protein